MFKPILLFLFFGSLFSCKNEDQRKMSREVIFIDGSDYTIDTSSGATALGSLDNLKTKDNNEH